MERFVKLKTILAAALVLNASPYAWADDHIDEQVKTQILEREAEIRVRTAELEELARALSENSVELMELQGLGPEIAARVNQALVIEQRPVLGINIGAPGGGITGVKVMGVTPGGPAEEAGVQAGDVIIEIADANLASGRFDEAQEVLLAVLSEQQAGEPVVLKLKRDDDVEIVEVVPAQGAMRRFRGAPRAFVMNDLAGPGQFEHFDVFDMYITGAQMQWDGVELTELSEGLGRYFGTSEGLLVVRISGPAEALPLQEGDVIQLIDGRAPSSVGHAMRILRSYEAGEEVSVDVLREKRKRKLKIPVEEHTAAPKDSQ